VLLMDGTTPAYRDLSPSDSDGADIKELNRNLVKLGFNAANITVDDVWQAATTEGVDLLQESLGETETGTLTLGQIVFLPGDQLVTTVDGTLGATGAANASATVTPPSPEFVDYSVPVTPHAPSPHNASPNNASDHNAAKAHKCPSTTSTTNTTPSTTNTSPTQSTTGNQSSKCKGKKSGKPTAEQQLQALLALLKAETQQLKSNHNGSPGSGSPSGGGHPNSSSGSPSSTGSGNTGSGNNGSGNSGSGNSGSGNSGSGNATAILQTTSTQLVVTVDLAATVQSEAVVGEHVMVEMPNGDNVKGKITAVSPVAQSSSNNDNGNGNGGNGNSGNNGNGNGNGSSSTIPVTITLSGHNTGAGLDQAAVSVNFVQQKATNVLSVPVTALLATGGGNYAVQEATAPHTLIPVTTGLFAAGYVEVSGSGIYPGLAVTDSQG